MTRYYYYLYISCFAGQELSAIIYKARNKKVLKYYIYTDKLFIGRFREYNQAKQEALKHDLQDPYTGELRLRYWECV